METKFKKGDVLLSRDGKVFQFIQATEHDTLGTIAMVRPYRTNRKVGIRFEDVKIHPRIAEIEKDLASWQDQLNIK